eukprot:symbB.v1.2.013359.t1/scaffold942.1/size149982/10
MRLPGSFKQSGGAWVEATPYCTGLHSWADVARCPDLTLMRWPEHPGSCLSGKLPMARRPWPKAEIWMRYSHWKPKKKY